MTLLQTAINLRLQLEIDLHDLSDDQLQDRMNEIDAIRYELSDEDQDLYFDSI